MDTERVSIDFFCTYFYVLQFAQVCSLFFGVKFTLQRFKLLVSYPKFNLPLGEKLTTM